MKIFTATFLLLSFTANAADTNELTALVPAYGELPPTFLEQHQTPIIIGFFALIAFAFLFLRVIIRPKSAVILPPEVLAREALTKLLRQPEDGKLLSEASQILRRYVITAFELPAAEMTTAEFCAVLADNEKVGAELANSISDFLRECDERKFAPLPREAGVQASACSDNLLPAPGTLKRELQPAACALELVSRAEARLRSAPVPGAATLPAQNVLANQQAQPHSDIAASGDGRAP